MTRTVHNGLSQSAKDPVPLAARRYLAALTTPIGMDKWCILLLTLTAIMLLPGVLSLPIELWDESRNAVNAMEMAKSGRWIVPTFDLQPDHWNTKPPLLIWIIAILLRSGLDPMLALRLPSVVATMASVLLVYFICRSIARDRVAGLIAGLLLICSDLFMGDHVGRTGDYDALLSALCLGYVICIANYIDGEAHRRTGWMGAGGVLLLLAIMTKGVAAGMAVPGLMAYAALRGRLIEILLDWRSWLTIVGVFSVVATWIVLRERLDPGYFAAMWFNDVGGRLLTAQNDHAGSPFFYLRTMLLNFEPAVLLSFTLLFVRDRDPARRHLYLLTLLTACSWLIVVSTASTKLYWYVAPALPLFAIPIGLATSSFLLSRTWTWAVCVVALPTTVAGLLAFWYINIRISDVTNLHAAAPHAADQVWYGPFLDEARALTPLDGVMIVDHGIYEGTDLKRYNPVAMFFAEDAERRGERIRVVPPGALVANGATIVSCDPWVRDWLNAQTFFTVIHGDVHCTLGRTTMGAPNISAPNIAPGG
jgi:4-amino-4-deoxy-L-arabinose transferase-like glycosyltransferase